MPTPDPTSLAGGISIGIVTFDADDEMLEAAVDSVIVSIGRVTIPVAVDVIDNGTKAASRLAHLDDDRVEVITTGHNGGFAAAVNIGFRRGRARGARFVACLNDDVVVTPDWLVPLIDALDRDPELGGVQPLLVDPSAGLIDSAGVVLDRYGAGSDRLRGEAKSVARPAAVEAMTGGAMMVRATVLDSVGYLDERFFLYYEDVEWCQRSARHGWRFAVVPDSVVYHRGSATAVQLGDRLRLLQDRNRLWNAALHAPPRQIVAAIWLSIRRLRYHPRRAHWLALTSGVAGMAPRLLRRWRDTDRTGAGGAAASGHRDAA